MGAHLRAGGFDDGGETALNKLPRILTLLLGLLGAGIAAYLTFTHFNIMVDPEFQSGCNLGGNLNCDAVNSSQFSEVMGIPIALVGVAFYLAIAALSILSLLPGQDSPRAPAMIWGLSVLAVFLSACLAFISGAIIGAWCLFCMSLYAVNLALLGASWWGAGLSLKPLVKELDLELRGFYKSPVVYVTLATFLGGLWFGVLIYDDNVDTAIAEARVARTAEMAQKAVEDASRDGREVDREDAEAMKKAQTIAEPPKKEITLRGDEPFKGGADAVVTVVEFADFECPYCSRAADTLYEVADRLGDRVKIIYKHYPLDQSCNALVDRPMHKNACGASLAAICAHKQGKFWPFHKRLFANQNDLDADDLQEYAVEIGLDIDAWETCQRASATMSTLQSDIDAAVEARISGTPSVFINGRQEKSRAVIDADLLTQIIEEEIRKASQ